MKSHSLTVRVARFAALSLLLTACTTTSKSPTPVAEGPKQPCDDYFQFVNAEWIAAHPIPADQPRWGSFVELWEGNQARMRELLGSIGAPKAKTNARYAKLKQFYDAGMDEAGIEKAGLRPIRPELDRIEKIASLKDLPATLAYFHAREVAMLFVPYVSEDDRDPKHYLFQIQQHGLGLPDRDYYLKTDEASKQLLAKYQAHVQDTLARSGVEAAVAQAQAKHVLDIETDLARISMSRTDQRDPNRVYNKLSQAQIAARAPGLDWNAYFRGLRLAAKYPVNAHQPDYLAGVAALLGKYPLESWKGYFRWHLVKSMAGALPKGFVDANFAFYGATLTGAKEIKPRWKRIVNAADDQVGELLGRLYVEKYFPASSKQKVERMVGYLEGALREKIEALAWMAPETKAKALQKLQKVQLKIGYPSKWRDYSKLRVGKDYARNLLAAQQFDFDRLLAKLPKPVDRTEWAMTPPTVNAYYNPNQNEIVFPAGILQAPFFDPSASDGANFGGIGAVIGHEITHGFDDQGRLFDADGALHEWWTESDRKAYEARTDLMVKQFDGYESLPGKRLNGKLTLGENIADLGGVKIALAAYHRYLQDAKSDNLVMGAQSALRSPDLDPSRQFFVGYATIWRASARPEYQAMAILTDPHSPPRFRVNGPLSNLSEFSTAYGCGEGSAMVRASGQRPEIW